MFRLLPIFAVCLSFSRAIDWDEPNELDAYVHSEDGFFSWTELEHYELEELDIYMLNMTSQQWMDETFSSASIWYHEMAVAIPKELDFDDAAFLAVYGGDNDEFTEPAEVNATNNVILRWFANHTRTVAAFMRQVPNQPVVFPSDPTDSKREDDWIAWTWIEAQRVNGTVPEMIARFPMTKAAKRGMDTVNEVVLQKTGNNVTRFHVAGPSKRGWTTWSIAMMDRRVISISPLVYSLLHFEEVLMHHYQSMDQAWSWALGPYYNVNLTCFLLDPLADLLYEYEDPYRYRERLTIPKLVISATGDEFFLLSDTHYWWDDMPGNNWFMMNQNTDHILFPAWFRIAENLVAFWRAVLNNFDVPTVTWTRSVEGEVGTVTLTASEEPLAVRAWVSETLDNGTRRDFRLVGGQPPEPQRILWREENVTLVGEPGSLTYAHTTTAIDEKWVGHFIQVDFEGPEGFNYQFTSEVNIVPDSFPGEACSTDAPEECCGYLT